MTRTVLTNARLLDGLRPSRHGVTITVDGARILEVDDGPVAPDADADVHDLAGRTVMPGMVSGHFHAAYDDVVTTQDVDMKHPATYATLLAARNVLLALRAGYTSVASASCVHNIDVALKQAISDGLIIGPRILAGSKDFCTSGGPIDTRPAHWGESPVSVLNLCDGPDEFRKAIRQEIKLGVEVIKLHVTGGHGLQGPENLVMTDEELKAAVETAHALGKLIRGHVATKDGVLRAVDAGLDIIDHGDGMDEECITALAQAGTFLVPSALSTRDFIDRSRQAGRMSERTLTRLERSHASHCEAINKADAAGVRVVPGDDYGTVLRHGDYSKELEVYVKDAGVSALRVLSWATRNGTQMMGAGDTLGTVEPGKIADLLVTDGDPSSDITLLQDSARLHAVMKAGQFVDSSL